jgi:hypothetical protein
MGDVKLLVMQQKQQQQRRQQEVEATGKGLGVQVQFGSSSRGGSAGGAMMGHKGWGGGGGGAAAAAVQSPGEQEQQWPNHSYHWCVKLTSQACSTCARVCTRVEGEEGGQSCYDDPGQPLPPFAPLQQQYQQLHVYGENNIHIQAVCRLQHHDEQEEQQQKQGSQHDAVCASCNDVNTKTAAADKCDDTAATPGSPASAYIVLQHYYAPPPVRLLQHPLLQAGHPGRRSGMGLEGGSYKAACIRSEEGTWGLARAHERRSMMARALLAWVEAAAWGCVAM